MGSMWNGVHVMPGTLSAEIKNRLDFWERFFESVRYSHCKEKL